MYAAGEDVWSIHREAPEFTEQSTEQEILVTGIKVRRCLVRAAKARLVGVWHGYGARPSAW